MYVIFTLRIFAMVRIVLNTESPILYGFPIMIHDRKISNTKISPLHYQTGTIYIDLDFFPYFYLNSNNKTNIYIYISLKYFTKHAWAILLFPGTYTLQSSVAYK